MPQENKKRILIVEDDSEMLEVLTLLLEKKYFVCTAMNGFEGVKTANELRPELILTDIKMPTLNGFHAIELIKSNQELRQIPIVVLSGYGGPNEVEKALSVGASEFVAKPFENKVLLQVIERCLKNGGEKSQSGVVSYLGLHLDPSQRKVWTDNIELHFSRIEFSLLSLLVYQRGQVVSREEILRKVWKNEAASSRVMDAHFVSIKNKLKEVPSLALASYYGKGYALEAAKI